MSLLFALDLFDGQIDLLGDSVGLVLDDSSLALGAEIIFTINSGLDFRERSFDAGEISLHGFDVGLGALALGSLLEKSLGVVNGGLGFSLSLDSRVFWLLRSGRESEP